MSKILKSIVMFVFIVMLLVPVTSSKAAIQWPNDSSNQVPINKNWEIKFTHYVLKDSVNENSIYILDSNGIKVKNRIEVEGNKIKVIYPSGGYQYDSEYTLNIDSSITSKYNNTLLEEDVIFAFKTMPDFNQFIQGKWKTTWDGWNAEIHFNNNSIIGKSSGFTEEGTYMIEGAKLTVNLAQKTKIGEITKISDNKFIVTEYPGKFMTFERVPN